MHAFCSCENANINCFESDMAINDAGNDNLIRVRNGIVSHVGFLFHTVGRANPYATFEAIGLVEPNAGDATPSPA